MEKNARLPLYLPMEIEILLSMERERFTWNEDLENTENFQFVRKMYFFPEKERHIACGQSCT